MIRCAIVAKSNIERCHFSRVSTLETDESDFIDASPQSSNFPANSLIYSKPDMLSRNGDSELTTNVEPDRQRNFEHIVTFYVIYAVINDTSRILMKYITVII